MFNLNQGGDAALTDDITAGGQDGISFVNPMGEIFLLPLAGKAFSSFISVTGGQKRGGREQRASPGRNTEVCVSLPPDSDSVGEEGMGSSPLRH